MSVWDEKQQAQVSAALVALSKWIDAGNAHRDPEAITWGRLAKLTEESGEVVAAYIGATGQNPRKGVTHDLDQVGKELLDVAITALGALEHLRGHDGQALALLNAAIVTVAVRAGVAAVHVADLPTRPCPECAAGKHGNCDGTTWDNTRDERVPCPCPSAQHPAQPTEPA